MASMNEKDYYALLEVEKDASTEEIRKAFQQKARKLHPDVNKAPDAEERFKEISEAYAVLSDDDKRRRYDAMRSGNPFAGAAGGYGYGRPAGTATGSYDGDPFGWDFPFGGTYTGRRTTTTRSHAYNPKEGTDIVYEVTIDDEAAARGVRRNMTYQHYATCEVCHGHGSTEHTTPVTCPTCGGTGRMSVDLTTLFGMGYIEVTCPECDGTGRVVADPCEVCNGSGRVLTASEIVIDIPAGSHDGDTIRKEGMGNAGTNGQASGDFVCKVLLPSERLAPRQATGAGIVGFALPFIILGIISPTNRFNMLMGFFLAIFGLYQLVRDGISTNPRWLRHVGEAVGNGVVRSLALVAIIQVFLILAQFFGPLLLIMVPLIIFFTFMNRARF